MTFDTLTGEQTWNGSQAKFHSIWTPTKAKNHIGLKECHLSIAAQQGRGNCSRVKTSKQTALVGLDEDLGTFWETRYELPEGTILKVTGWKQEEGFKKFANFYLRMREGAALRMVKLDLPNAGGRARFPYAYARGHFDIITPGEAETWGVKTNAVFHKTFGKSRFKLCFEDMILEPEKEAKTVLVEATVDTPKGGKQAVMMFEKVRKIRNR